MNPETDANSQTTPLSRRHFLGTVAGASALALAGCGGGNEPAGEGGDQPGGDGGSEGGSAGGDASSPTPSGGGSGSGDASGCVQWSSMSPYDVSDTDFAVVPSFPPGWKKYRETYTEGYVELGFAWPETADENSQEDVVLITQLNGPSEGGVVEGLVDTGIYELGEPVVLGGESVPVAEKIDEFGGLWQLSVPGPNDAYYGTQIITRGEREDCSEQLEALGQEFIASLELNSNTTL